MRATPTKDGTQPVERCCRCARPAAMPLVSLQGQPRGRLPLCLDCLALWLADPVAFGRPPPYGGQQAEPPSRPA